MSRKKSIKSAQSASRSTKATQKPARKSAQQPAPRRVAAKVAPPKNARKKNAAAGLDQVAEYRHGEATRTNNPPAKIAAEGTIPLMGKIRYEYNPRLSPVLRFDPAGGPDALPELLQQAQQRKLSADETKLLAEALRIQEPWLEWANKREKQHFEVDPVALHIHERVSPQAILRVAARQDVERSLFADPEQSYNEAVQFYKHEVPWTNRLILGDSLQVMTSLAKREDLAGKVQMIYIDPPYGIKFGSNFQPEVGKRDVKDKEQDLTREPEMVKAYRDTWHLGIHSYLSYLRERLTIAKELLSDSGSIFVQISDANLHRVRNILDEVFDSSNFVSVITTKKTGGMGEELIDNVSDYVLWYAKDKAKAAAGFNALYIPKDLAEGAGERYSRVELQDGSIRPITDEEATKPSLLPEGSRVFLGGPMTSETASESTTFDFELEGKQVKLRKGGWKTNKTGMTRLIKSERVIATREFVNYKMLFSDFPAVTLGNLWDDTMGTAEQNKVYVVQTTTKVIQRCLLMTTKPGDLVLDPTCGSGTTAFVAEQWGRRWITTDTSRVAIAIARQRLLTAKFDYYRVAGDDSNLSSGLIYKTIPHIMLKSIARNQNLDPIFAKHEPILNELLGKLNSAVSKVDATKKQKLVEKLIAKHRELGSGAITDADVRRWILPETDPWLFRSSSGNKSFKGVTPKQVENYRASIPQRKWREWQVPFDTDPEWPQELQNAVKAYRSAWRKKMDEVEASIGANAEPEELIDQPNIVTGVTRVSGPFTVEAVQPPEMSLGETKTITDEGEFGGAPEELESFPPFTMQMVESRLDQEEQNLEAYLDQMMRYLKMDGVRFPNNKEMKFHRLEPVLDGSTIHAEGRWANGEKDPDPEGRANVGVVFGPQYGPVTTPQVEDAIRQASRRGYDHLVIAGFSFDGASTGTISEIKHPKVQVHQAHIRPDVNPGMEGLLKEQPGSQLFSVFGLPRIRVEGPNNENDYIVEMEGVDIYDPLKNSTLPTNADKVAAWFLDGDYDGRCFCITQAFFPDRSAWEKLSKALTGVVDSARFEALSGTRSLPFPAGRHKCVAVKVIDPRGNEVMTVNRLEERRGR
jgi:adenine-specific DNA-methyltransferase